MQRMSQAETDIQSIEEEIGYSGGCNGSLTARITTLETIVGDSTSGLVKKVNDLESKIYRFSGSIINVDDPDNTTAIILSDNSQINNTDLKNGQVFDINPTSGNSITMTINSQTSEYSKGNNIAWTVPESGDAYFDELGMNIDIDELNGIKSDVDTLKSYFKTETINSSWTSASIPKGIYQFSSVVGNAAQGLKLSVFILAFNNGQSQTTDPADISGNFSTYWEFDSDLYLKPKGMSSGTRTLSIHKIGDI